VLVVVAVWCSSSRGLASSSLERHVFAPPIALTMFSLRLWLEVSSFLLGDVWDCLWLCSCGIHPCCIDFSPVFNN
jgi:hypothetical protein